MLSLYYLVVSHTNLNETVGKFGWKLFLAVADLGGQMGATAPLRDENSALAPPFWKEKRPLS